MGGAYSMHERWKMHAFYLDNLKGKHMGRCEDNIKIDLDDYDHVDEVTLCL
jgi:hypothetical protein